MSDAPTPQIRYHAFDALRAAMMLLGVVLHATQYYITVALYPGFDFRDASTSSVCTVLFFGIHAFRMQVFFVMAGFFAALLCERQGAKGMWRNRLKRVGLPLLVGWLILFLPTISAFVYGTAKNAGYPAWASLTNWWRTGDIPWVDGWQPIYNLFMISPLHLWFLYCLLWFYLFALAARRIGRIGGGRVSRGMTGLFRALGERHLLLPAAIGLSTLTLLVNPSGLFAQEFPLFFPNPLAFLAYGPFFAFGWLLYRNTDLLPRFDRRPVLALGVAIVVFVYYMSLFRDAFTPEGVNTQRLAMAVLGSTIAWLCVFGFVGLFQRHFQRPSPAMRYVSDSAYWVYLAHLPLIYWMQGLLFDLRVPALVKVAIILGVATPLLLISYDLLARPTFIGRLLNGRTYPSVLVPFRSTKPAIVPATIAVAEPGPSS